MNIGIVLIKVILLIAVIDYFFSLMRAFHIDVVERCRSFIAR